MTSSWMQRLEWQHLDWKHPPKYQESTRHVLFVREGRHFSIVNKRTTREQQARRKKTSIEHAMETGNDSAYIENTQNTHDFRSITMEVIL